MLIKQIAAVCLLLFAAVVCQADAGLDADDIMKKVESVYDCDSLIADFTQISILKALDLTDTAHGRVLFKRPDKVRWEYKTPTPQFIMSDGETLWVYKPEENQVVVGEAERLLGKGKAVSFLVDIFSIRNYFETQVSETRKKEGFYVLHLVPLEEMHQISNVHLFISKKTHHVVEIELTNAFEEVTNIMFNNITMDQKVDGSMFKFEIPIDAEVIALDVQM